MNFTDDEYDADFRGLFGEVVTEDVYRLRQLAEPPDVIFDLGANVGIFTRYAAELFPNARIVSIEPDAANFGILTAATSDNQMITRINAAIGTEHVWRGPGAVNGAHEVYLSVGLGYDKEFLDDVCMLTEIPVILPDVLYEEHAKPGDRTFWKIDIEGGENSIVSHPPSCLVLSQADNIAIELHHHSSHGGPQQMEVREATAQWIETLRETHEVEREHVMMYARKL